jgi:hypothetical protein
LLLPLLLPVTILVGSVGFAPVGVGIGLVGLGFGPVGFGFGFSGFTSIGLGLASGPPPGGPVHRPGYRIEHVVPEGQAEQGLPVSYIVSLGNEKKDVKLSRRFIVV